MGARANAVVVGLVAAAVGGGCAIKQDDAERFREAVPLKDEVALNVPGGRGAATTAKSASGLHITTNGPATAGASTTARYYRFSRDMTGAVDFGTAIVLGGVWAIVNSPPTEIDAKHAVWGPGQGNALDPVVYRFTATEVGDAEYDYVLEGRPKAGGDFVALLRGHGFGKTRPEHRSGWFSTDNDAFAKLDPDHGHDTGTTKVTYDLRDVPGTIKVELRGNPNGDWADVRVTHDAGGAGSVEITGLGDIDDSKSTKSEDVHLLSRWATDGSGRADVVLEHGDLPFTVDASECWSSSFARVYYKDTVDFEPPAGDASACAFAAAKL